MVQRLLDQLSESGEGEERDRVAARAEIFLRDSDCAPRTNKCHKFAFH
jgi:hypothetical protein